MRRLKTPQALAAVAALSLVVLGVLGFLPGVTHHHSSLHFWKQGSRAELFGVFQVSILGNLIYAVYGVFGYAVSSTIVAARLYLVCGGIGFLGVAVYRAAIETTSRANVIPLNHADNLLLLGLGLGFLVLAGFAAHLDRPVQAEPPAWPVPPA